MYSCRLSLEASCSASSTTKFNDSSLPSTSDSQRKDIAAPPTPKTVRMTAAIQTNCETNKIFLNVVPVRVSAGGNFVDTLAFLDQGSTTTLCHEFLLDKLEICGEQANYSISTINQTKKCNRGRGAKWFVSSLQEGDQIKLANVYCVEDLPVLPNPTSNKDDLKEWPHLRELDIPTIKDGKVLLLIGVDNPELFWTLDERHGKRCQPYAVKGVLGWSLIGCGTRSENKNFCINFVRKSDQVIQEQIQGLRKLDNVPDITVSSSAMSKNDRYALKLMEDSKKFVDGHYLLGLLWCPGSPTLRSDYCQALSRLQSLKRRFSKDPNLQTLYTSAIEDCLSKGYAQQLYEDEVNFERADECWYLPHHAVFHAKKPNKIRVVFDCAAQYNGTSLNEQLLPGPDILNSLIGVLSRFRKKKK